MSLKAVLSTSTIAVGAKLENGVMNGATTATKALISRKLLEQDNFCSAGA
jgi:hypothetical protein